MKKKADIVDKLLPKIKSWTISFLKTKLVGDLPNFDSTSAFEELKNTNIVDEIKTETTNENEILNVLKEISIKAKELAFRMSRNFVFAAATDSDQDMIADIDAKGEELYHELYDGLHDNIMETAADLYNEVANIHDGSGNFHTELFMKLAKSNIETELTDLLADKLEPYKWHYTDYNERYVEELKTEVACIIDRIVEDMIDAFGDKE